MENHFLFVLKYTVLLLAQVAFLGCSAQNIGYYTSISDALISPEKVKSLNLTGVTLDDKLYLFSSLEELHLLDCTLDSISIDIKNLKSLKIFRSKSSEISWISNTLQELDNLEELTITGSGLDTIGFGFKNFKNLKIFNFSNNKISSLQDQIFENTSNLMTVNLSGNKLKKIPTSLYSLTKLEKLVLFNNKNISSVSSEIKNLLDLKELYLNKNSITKVPKEIFSLKSLSILDMSYNKIEQLPSIKINTSIKKISLKGNPINKSTIAKLRTSLSPSVKLIF